MKKIIYLLVLVFSIGCSSDESSIDIDAQNEAEITQYLTDKNLTAQKTASGLYYIITKQGSGMEKPTSNSEVTVFYEGFFTNGKIFDKSKTSAGTDFGLNEVVSGFSEGLQLLTEGGEARLILPSRLGYGSRGSGSIPPGSVILFDVKLIKINP